MEFVKGEAFLEALRIRDKSGLVLKVLGEYVRLGFITEILGKFGFDEDLPESKKHLNYAGLTLQSKRILNRINGKLSEKGWTPEELLGDALKTQSVKTKTKVEQVGIIKSAEFFQRLKELGLIRSAEIKENLQKFLCIDDTYQDSLMFKKLARALKDFKLSQALLCVGQRKIKVPKEFYGGEEE